MLGHPNSRTAFINDSVHQDEEGWWFWIETWADREGSFETEEAARHQLNRYCDWLNGKITDEDVRKFPLKQTLE